MKRALVAIGLILCVACEREPTQIELFDPRLIVHSLLRAGEDSIRVFVSRLDMRESSPTESPLVPVLNARVRIGHGADTLVLATRSHCVNEANGFPQYTSDLNRGCYAAAIAGGVRPGERYQLFVDADGERARGEAVVPVLPVMHSPAPGITLHYSPTRQPELATSVVVRWSRIDPNRRIDLSLRPVQRTCDALIMTPPERFGSARIAFLAGDTATIAPFDVQCLDATPATVPAELLLTAYDAAYSAMRFTWTTVRPEAAAAGLMEGLGVFAAAATVAIPVTLVRR